MHFKIKTEDGERQIIRDANTTIKLSFKMSLMEKVPYAIIVGFTSGDIIYDHDLSEGRHKAVVEVFDIRGTYTKDATLDVKDGIISIL